MKSIVLKEPGHFELADTEELAAPREGEVLVRIRHVGLCGTDIHAYAGRQPFFEYPRILGHELGVEVEAVGSAVNGLQVGDRCSVEPYLSHSGDKAFARGRTNCSSSTRCLGVHLDGGMQERLLVSAGKLHPSQSLGTRELALVETLCIGHHAVARANLIGDEVIAVVGMGPIGLGVAQFARLSGARVVCVDVSESRLEQAQSLLPDVETLSRDLEQPFNADWDAFAPERPEVVFDCTGHDKSMEASIAMAGFGGRVVLVGIFKGNITFSDPDFHKRELTLLASRNAVASDFKSVIAKIEEGMVSVQPWITHQCGFEAFPTEVESWLQKDSGLLKGVIEF